MLNGAWRLGDSGTWRLEAGVANSETRGLGDSGTRGLEACVAYLVLGLGVPLVKGVRAIACRQH